MRPCWKAPPSDAIFGHIVTRTCTGTVRPFLARAAGVAVVTGALLALTACPSGVDWSDYQGVNLVANRQFGSTDANGGSLWYFADGLDKDTDSSLPYDYVQFEEVSSEVYGSLPSGVSGPVYRLEVKNLFADGTFENSGATVDVDNGHETAPNGPDWQWAGGGTANSATIVNSASTAPYKSSIDGLSLFLNAEDSSQRYTADLSSSSTILDGGASAGEKYAFSLDLKMAIQSLGVELNDNASTGSVNARYAISRSGVISETLVYSFPPTGGENTVTQDAVAEGTNEITIESGLTWFSFGGIDPKVQQDRTEAVVDNIRFVRADQNHLLRLPVPYADPAGTRPELRGGGSYTVRLWVRDDPTAESVGTPNRIPARFISVGIDPRTNTAVPVTKTRSTGASARRFVGDLNGWKELTVQLSGAAIQTDTSMTSATIVFDLTIEIGDSSSAAFRDAGSILIGAVELEWSPYSL